MQEHEGQQLGNHRPSHLLGEGAIAETTYEALPSEEHRQLARTLFVCLVQPGEAGQEPARRRVDASEFTLEDTEQNRVLHEVSDAFIAASLVTVNQSTETTTLEISHEALIREWPRLTNWLEEAGEDMRMQQTMSSDAGEWERHGRPKDRLYRGSQLRESLAWCQRNVASSSEAAFLRASAARRTRTRISFLLVAVLILGLLGTAGLLFVQRYGPNAPITVTTLKDGVPGSLRQAMASARPGRTIVFASNLKGVMTLNSSLEINKSVTIRGPGTNVLTLRGTREQGFLIQVDAHTTVTISQLTFSDPTAQNGSVIVNRGDLTLDGCNISGNMEKSNNQTSGGGVSNLNGMLTLQNSIVSHNTVQAGDSFGGGISGDGGSITITNSQIIDNITIATGQHSAGGGISTTKSDLTLINTVVAGNSARGGQQFSEGGGIASALDTIMLTSSTITDNTVTGKGQSDGGGISSGGSSITTTDSIISKNSVTSSGGFATGGGIYNEKGQTTPIKTTVSHNTVKSLQSNGSGGGIFDDGILIVTDSTISDNTINASTADPFGVVGGGITTLGSLNLDGSSIVGNTITNNQGGAEGGGLFAGTSKVAQAAAELTNSTIADNTVQGTTQGNGGGFDLDRANSSMNFCTIDGNTASSNGGGIGIETLNDATTANLAMKNSLIAANNAATGPDIAGPVTTGGYNLVQNLADMQFNGPANDQQTDLSGDRYPSLHLATQPRNNGGPTPTIALQTGSPAINVIPIASCGASTDQRGSKRPQHNACDIGAYEY